MDSAQGIRAGGRNPHGAMSLAEEQVRFFREQGYLVAEGVLRDEDLAPVIAEYEIWLYCRALELGILDMHLYAPFERRAALLYAEDRQILSEMDIMMVRGPASFEFLRNERLLDAVDSIIGPEITCSPIQHIRAKPPQSLSRSEEHTSELQS